MKLESVVNQSYQSEPCVQVRSELIASNPRRQGNRSTIYRQFVALAIVAVRLSLFLLHTHVLPNAENSVAGNSIYLNDAHCLACDLDSTAAVEAGPIVVLPSRFAQSVAFLNQEKLSVALQLWRNLSTRGPPVDIS